MVSHGVREDVNFSYLKLSIQNELLTGMDNN